jgi:hypothetical protein
MNLRIKQGPGIAVASAQPLGPTLSAGYLGILYMWACDFLLKQTSGSGRAGAWFGRVICVVHHCVFQPCSLANQYESASHPANRAITCCPSVRAMLIWPISVLPCAVAHGPCRLLRHYALQEALSWVVQENAPGIWLLEIGITMVLLLRRLCRTRFWCHFLKFSRFGCLFNN